ncbi:acetyltransferase [Cyclobacterium xiamenense]|jgi:sugar O-acyltransferase (sialic acid O-acetyltransferase NeuD family)|uniref:acetyltransferase n=1 Tax=Cyclobacterium xiamenense TaxID=1297121 RepID=UPI0012B96970|nr:acetyltransferase [Cyclobacterium xiamenense]
MKRIILVGAGGHAAELYEYIAYANAVRSSSMRMEVVGIIDDNPQNYEEYAYEAPFLGSIRSHVPESGVQYLLGIANLKYREGLVRSLQERGAAFTRFIHPMAFVSKSAYIGQGVVIAPNVTIGPLAKIGDFTLVNSRCSIAHNTLVGRYNFLSPNVCFSGHTAVGDSNMFGINSATIPGIRVGSRNKIMAGLTLVHSIGDDQAVFYRYKERILMPVLDK